MIRIGIGTLRDHAFSISFYENNRFQNSCDEMGSLCELRIPGAGHLGERTGLRDQDERGGIDGIHG